MAEVSEYMRSYTSFSGADITAAFNGIIFAELQGITYSINREKSPIYTMGSAEPRSFSRGKRGIAGTMVFAVFDRDCLIDAFRQVMEENKDSLYIQKFKMNDPTYVNQKLNSVTGFSSIEEWDEQMTGLARSSLSDSNTSDSGNLTDKFMPHYADEILPFDITLVFANEYGNRCALSIYGIEIINEGTGFSTDTVVTEKAYSYVARRVTPLESLGRTGTTNFASSW